MSVRSVLTPAAPAVVFDAIAATAWADGTITLHELAAARAAARALDLPEANLARDAPRRGLVEDPRNLATADREVAVAASAWMALVDGQTQPAECTAVRRVARSLGVGEERRLALGELAARIRGSLSGSSTLAYEFEQVVRAAVLARRPMPA